MKRSTPRTSMLLVQEQMAVLARRIRVDQKEAASVIDARLTTFGYKLITALRDLGPMSAGGAADQLDVDRSVVSRHLPQLTDLGLVESTTAASDGRMRLLTLTPEAMRRLDAQGAHAATRLQQALADWTDDDLDRFGTYLQRLTTTGDDRGEMS